MRPRVRPHLEGYCGFDAEYIPSPSEFAANAHFRCATHETLGLAIRGACSLPLHGPRLSSLSLVSPSSGGCSADAVWY